MDKREIAMVLAETGRLLDLSGENPFKVRAYENAARAVDGFAGDFAALVAEGRLTEIRGVGKGLAEHIAELASTGRLAEHERLRGDIPSGVVQMLAIPGMGPKRVHHIWKAMGIDSIGELETACRRHLVEHQPGFGKKMEEKILAGIETVKRFAGKVLFAEAAAAAQGICGLVRSWPEVARAEVCGSLRRCKEIVADIDILVATEDPAAVMGRFVAMPEVAEVLQHGATKSEVRLACGIQCDLRAVEDVAFPFALHYFTGSKEHNVAMRSRAKKAALKLNEYGLFPEGQDRSLPCRDEEALFRALGLAFIEPELREDMGEIAAAAAGRLPVLVEQRDLRGVLHAHTSHSDGSASVAEMAAAAKGRGYAYLVVSDHSQSSLIASGLRPVEVAAQHREIDALNRKLSGFRVLKGIEVDILADGSLDYDDDLLASFDIVIAAVHSRFGLPEQEMTARIVRALANPHVDILAHPTGRLLLAREPYAVDLQAVIDAAAAHGTAIEINAHPQRLDLDWRWCRYAKERGVKLAIDPDAHAPEGFDDVAYGVNVARKGWLERVDILNGLTAEELLEHFRR